MQAEVTRFPLPDPGDVSGLKSAIDHREIDPLSIKAVIGKTHGNGLVNDYTRGYLAQSLAYLIAGATGETPEAVRARIPFIFSGGVEGLLSPHYTVFTASDGDGAAGPALAIGVAFTPDLRPEDIGRERQMALTAAAVADAMRSARIESPSDVDFVQVKGPAFTLADIAASTSRGGKVLTDNPAKLMGFGRAGSALGVARALGEAVTAEEDVLRDFAKFSSVASCSAGVEIRCNEVVVLGTSRSWSGPLGIAHAPLADALDVSGVHTALAALGMTANPQLGARDAARIRAAFVKCEASRDGLVRGKPHTMLNDGDIDQQRHIRAAVGAIVASVLGDTALFVSGGAEHQGPDGGGLVAIIAERT